VLDTNKKKLLRVDPKTGEAKWTTDFRRQSSVRASPTGADGKVYCENANGDVWVVSAEDGKVLSQLALRGRARGGRSSLVIDSSSFARARRCTPSEQSNKTQIVYSAMNACL